jgi:hypothetical protein
MTTAALMCNSCGTEVSAKAKSCSECGASIMTSTLVRVVTAGFRAEVWRCGQPRP